MTATRLASIEDIRAALHATIPYPSTWPGGDHSKWSQHYAERIFAILPAAPAEAGLRAALVVIATINESRVTVEQAAALGYLDAALAAQEGAGE